MRRTLNADAHALKQHGLSQNSAPPPPISAPVCFLLVIASDMHLEPESEKRVQNVDSHKVSSDVLVTVV